MRNRKTKEYKYELTEKKKEYISFLKDFLNEVWWSDWGNGYEGHKWGTEHSFRTIPEYQPTHTSNRDIHYVILEWLDRLSTEYHQLYPQLGDRIHIFPDYREGYFELSKKEEKVWNKYRRTFNRILKEVLYKDKKYYNDEERIVMNLFRGLHELWNKCFEFWVLGLQEKWGNTKYLKPRG